MNIHREHFQNCLNLQKAFLYYFFIILNQRLSCKCTMLKIQGLTLPHAAVNFELRKQENVSTRTDTCCIKQNKKFAMIVFNWDFSMEFHQSKYRSYPWIWASTKWGLFIQQEILTILTSTLVFTLLNIRSLRRHIVDIASDLHLIESDM